MNEAPRLNVKWPFNPRAIRRDPRYFKVRVAIEFVACCVVMACCVIAAHVLWGI